MRWEDLMICEDWRGLFQDTRLISLFNLTGCLSDNWLGKLNGILWLAECVKRWFTVKLDYFVLCIHQCSFNFFLFACCAFVIFCSDAHAVNQILRYESLFSTLTREIGTCETINVARARICLWCFSHTDFLFQIIYVVLMKVGWVNAPSHFSCLSHLIPGIGRALPVPVKFLVDFCWSCRCILLPSRNSWWNRNRRDHSFLVSIQGYVTSGRWYDHWGDILIRYRLLTMYRFILL